MKGGWSRFYPPLPPGKGLLIESLTSRSAMSEPFAFQLSLMSQNAAIDLTDMMGKNVAVSVQQSDGSEHFINGYVNSFAATRSDGGFAFYYTEVVPWTTYLKRRVNLRIFQDRSPARLCGERTIVVDTESRENFEHPRSDQGRLGPYWRWQLSIEVEVRLGSQEVAKEAFAQALSASLRMRFQSGATVAWQAGDADNTTFGNRQSSFTVSAGAEAEVECLVFSAGSEEDLGEEGGWWVTVAVVERTPSSYLLMLLTAACLAELADSDIVDDALMLKMGRQIQAADLHAAIAPHRQASFAASGRAVAIALGGKA